MVFQYLGPYFIRKWIFCIVRLITPPFPIKCIFIRNKFYMFMLVFIHITEMFGMHNGICPLYCLRIHPHPTEHKQHYHEKHLFISITIDARNIHIYYKIHDFCALKQATKKPESFSTSGLPIYSNESYMRSGTSIPNKPIASFTILPTFWLNAKRKIFNASFSSRKMLKSW